MTGEADPFDPTLAQALREQVGPGFRAEAELEEQDARKMDLRSRTMGHVAYALMTRGTHVAVHAGTAVLSGPIVHTRSDLAVVALGHEARAHVNLAGPIAFRTLEARSPGRTWDRAGAGSFVADLRQLDIEHAFVQVHGPVEDIAGAVMAVTPDHLMLDTGAATCHVPLARIAALVVRPG